MKAYVVCEDYPREMLMIEFINVFTSSILCWFSWLVCVGCCGRYFICSWFGRVSEARMVSSLSSNRGKKYEGIILQLYPYTTLALEGEGRSITCPHCFTPGKRPSTHSTGGWVAFGTCFLWGGLNTRPSSQQQVTIPTTLTRLPFFYIALHVKPKL
jgi:hypothetical protein